MDGTCWAIVIPEVGKVSEWFYEASCIGGEEKAQRQQIYCLHILSDLRCYSSLRIPHSSPRTRWRPGGAFSRSHFFFFHISLSSHILVKAPSILLPLSWSLSKHAVTFLTSPSRSSRSPRSSLLALLSACPLLVCLQMININYVSVSFLVILKARRNDAAARTLYSVSRASDRGCSP